MCELGCVSLFPIFSYEFTICELQLALVMCVSMSPILAHFNNNCWTISLSLIVAAAADANAAAAQQQQQQAAAAATAAAQQQQQQAAAAAAAHHQQQQQAVAAQQHATMMQQQQAAMTAGTMPGAMPGQPGAMPGAMPGMQPMGAQAYGKREMLYCSWSRYYCFVVVYRSFGGTLKQWRHC